MTRTITTADAITRALWGAPAAQCPPDGAVLAVPGTSGDRWMHGDDTAGVEWCHDCRRDGFGFIRAKMLDGSELVALNDLGNVILFDGSDLAIRCLGKGVSGREGATLRAAISN